MADVTFADLAKLTDREIQVLMREVNHQDLLVVLKGADAKTRARFSRNLSKGNQAALEAEMDGIHPTRAQIEETRQRVVNHAALLGEQRQVAWPPGTGVRKAAKKPRVSKELAARKRAMPKEVARRLTEMSMAEIDQVLVTMSMIAREEGILATEAYAEKMADPFLQSAFRMAADGTEPDLLMDILETWLASLEYEYKRKHQKVIEGIMCVQSGDSPRIVETKLAILY